MFLFSEIEKALVPKKGLVTFALIAAYYRAQNRPARRPRLISAALSLYKALQ